MKYKAMSVQAYYEDMESLADATVVIRRWGKVYRIVYISPLHDGANYYFIQCGDPNGDCADDLTFRLPGYEPVYIQEERYELRSAT